MCVSICLCPGGPSLVGRGLCQLHHSWVWAFSLPTHCSLSSCAPCRTCGSPTPEAATACPARAAALCSAPTHSRSTRHPRPFSCSLQVRCPPSGLCLSTALSWPFFSLLGIIHTVPCIRLFSRSLPPPTPHLSFSSSLCHNLGAHTGVCLRLFRGLLSTQFERNGGDETQWPGFCRRESCLSVH